MIEALLQKIEEWFMRAVLPVLFNILLWLMRIVLIWAFVTMIGLSYKAASSAILQWIGSIL